MISRVKDLEFSVKRRLIEDVKYYSFLLIYSSSQKQQSASIPANSTNVDGGKNVM